VKSKRHSRRQRALVGVTPYLPALRNASGGVAGKRRITFLRPPERLQFCLTLLLNLLCIFHAIQWCTPVCGLVEESFGPARALRDV
jgi:hypothetical protein